MSDIIPKVGLYANHHGWSDVHPYEIIRVVSDKTLEIRALDVSDNKIKMDFIPGGFSAHCANQHQQEYDYSSNTDNPVTRIRLNRASQYCPDKVWKSKTGARFAISEHPCKFYDYNF